MIPQIVAVIDGVLVREGWPKYTNDPFDHGGPTKGGITLKTLSKYRGRKCTPEDIQNLAEPEVRAIYEAMYVTDWHFETISDAWVQNFVIDTGILSGQQTAAMMLQAVLHVPQDGDLGPTTFASLTMALVRPKALYLDLIRARMHLLLDAMVSEIPVAQRQSTNLKWRHGWWNRVADLFPKE